MESKEVLLYQVIGKRLRKKRKEQGLTQLELAQRAGLTRTSVTNIEQGIQHTSLYTLYELSQLLGFKSIFELLPGSLMELGTDGVHGARGKFPDEVLKRVLSQQ